MKSTELRQKTIQELDQLISKKRAELVQHKFQRSINRLKSTADITKTRKLIARMLSIKAEKQLSADSQGE